MYCAMSSKRNVLGSFTVSTLTATINICYLSQAFYDNSKTEALVKYVLLLYSHSLMLKVYGSHAKAQPHFDSV